MTALPETPLPESVEPSDDVIAVAENLIRLTRTFARRRAQILAIAAHDVEWSAHIVLKCLASEGPLRSGAIAEHIRADPSTVSRQVASLVKEGLLERRADPVDGRASLLVLTAKANETLKHHDDIRNEKYAQMLEDWSEADLRRFAALLRRFTNDFEAAEISPISGAGGTQRAAEGGR